MSGPAIDPALYRPRDVVRIRRALVSVSDKTNPGSTSQPTTAIQRYSNVFGSPGPLAPLVSSHSAASGLNRSHAA